MNEQKKNGFTLKSLAVVGFISIIVLIAWLSIQLVHIVPGAFSSLATLAESVNRQSERVDRATEDTIPLHITSNTTLSNTGEPVTLSWGEPNVPGTFTFSYACTNGIAVDLTDVEGLRSIDCETNYNIGNVTSLTIAVDSEKERYADLQYTVSFLGTNDTSPRASGNASLTVINSDIKNILVGEPEEETAPLWTDTETVASEQEVSETQTNTQPEESYTQEFVYTVPVSDPNGRVDLSVRFLNLGTIVGNTFFPGAVKQNESGAVQLEVHNLGTKTSEMWDLSMTLPSGSTYTLDDQTPLKPNEIATVTIGFPTGNDSSYTCVVTISTQADTNTLNNRFKQPVTFIK